VLDTFVLLAETRVTLGNNLDAYLNADDRLVKWLMRTGASFRRGRSYYSLRS
jgi:hypothetical protein